MRRFKFSKPLIESALPPKDHNVYWVSIDEFTGKVNGIAEWSDVTDNWEILLVTPPESQDWGDDIFPHKPCIDDKINGEIEIKDPLNPPIKDPGGEILIP